jgi:hypothetical protein
MHTIFGTDFMIVNTCSISLQHLHSTADGIIIQNVQVHLHKYHFMTEINHTVPKLLASLSSWS